MIGHPAVASVGTTPAEVDVPANVPAPGSPAMSKRLKGIRATDVLVAVFTNGILCLLEATYWSIVAMAIYFI
jgi:hypothetical protein